MSRSSTLACASLAALFALPTAARAQPVTIVQARVPYGDLDLSSEAGARVMLTRIRVTLDRLCAEPRTPVLPRAQAYALQCRTRAMRNAVAKLDAPMVSRAYAQQSSSWAHTVLAQQAGLR